MWCDLDSLEVARRADIGLRQLLLLAFGFLVLPAQAAVAQHVVDVIWLLMAVGVVESDIVDLRVLYVYCGHMQSWACACFRKLAERVEKVTTTIIFLNDF